MIRRDLSSPFDAIVATLPVGSVAYEADTNAMGERLIWIERVWADKLRAMRATGESYSDVILRLAAQSSGSLRTAETEEGEPWTQK